MIASWIEEYGRLMLPLGGGHEPSEANAVGARDEEQPAGARAILVAAEGTGPPGVGYTTFVIDSFRGRGLTEVCTSARTLVGTQRIPDAYGALRILATHPKIAARRVALMGFSHGGILTMGASTAWAKETFAPSGQPAFRAFLPFYPSCNTVYS